MDPIKNSDISSNQTRSLFDKPTGFILLAIWFGLVTGFGEIVWLGFRKIVQDRIIELSQDTFWMAPLADVMLFLIIGSVVVFIIKLIRPVLVRRTALFVLLFLCFLSLAYMKSRIHPFAVWLLAIGIALQISGILNKHYRKFTRFVSISLPIFLLIEIALVIGFVGTPYLIERNKITTLPPATPDAPNVLFIVLDTVRAQSLGMYGYDRPTSPNIDELSKLGVSFEYAISPSSWTFPSHGTMFTGRYPHELSVNWTTKMDNTYPTLAEYLSQHGYVTGGFSANTLYVDYEHGLDRGFLHFDDYPISPGQLLISSSLGRKIACWRGEGIGCPIRKLFGAYQTVGRKDAEAINAGVINWLSTAGDRPYFAFLNYYDAHDPYVPPADYADMFGPTKDQSRSWLVDGQKEGEWTPEEIQVETDAYDSSIAYLDSKLGELFTELGKQKKLDNTLVIITADHGEELLEHGKYGHGYNLYLTSLRVPLMIFSPKNIPANTTIPNVVSLRDIPATIVNFVGLEKNSPFPGASMSRYWHDSSTANSSNDPLISELNPRSRSTKNLETMSSVFDNEQQYIRNEDDSEELYNFRIDPLQTQNLAYSEGAQSILDGFRNTLESLYNDFAQTNTLNSLSRLISVMID